MPPIHSFGRTNTCGCTGFELIRFESKGNGHNQVFYRCQCGQESSTDFNNLKKKDRKAQCPKCQNKKKDFEELRMLFVENNCELLITSEQYKNNKQKLAFHCSCGAVSEIVAHDLKRGKLCIECKGDRTQQTCLERFGVENPFQNENIKEKIREKNMATLGVEYPQQSVEVRKKTEDTCLEKYGVKRAFCLPEVFQKIRQTHRTKYGCDFPLQAQEIQNKITLVFQQTIGAKRPFNSEVFLEKMKEKYGHKYFTCTDKFKEIMLEKYGVEHYVQSEQYKKDMLEKYGVEYPMQNAQLFRKAQMSSFRRKRYVSWDGKVYMLLGYEDKALEDIFEKEGQKILFAGEDKDIPTFRYVGEDNHYHYYYPDFFIPQENRVIEVKSIYTYNKNPRQH